MSYTRRQCLIFFFFNDTATTEIYTLSLHDALPICVALPADRAVAGRAARRTGSADPLESPHARDRKSTRLNSSHLVISYAVFCLKKKKTTIMIFLSTCCIHHLSVHI